MISPRRAPQPNLAASAPAATTKKKKGLFSPRRKDERCARCKKPFDEGRPRNPTTDLCLVCAKAQLAKSGGMPSKRVQQTQPRQQPKQQPTQPATQQSKQPQQQPAKQQVKPQQQSKQPQSPTQSSNAPSSPKSTKKIQHTRLKQEINISDATPEQFARLAEAEPVEDDVLAIV